MRSSTKNKKGAKSDTGLRNQTLPLSRTYQMHAEHLSRQLSPLASKCYNLPHGSRKQFSSCAEEKRQNREDVTLFGGDTSLYLRNS